MSCRARAKICGPQARVFDQKLGINLPGHRRTGATLQKHSRDRSIALIIAIYYGHHHVGSMVAGLMPGQNVAASNCAVIWSIL